MKSKQIGGLHCLVTGDPSKPAIVFFHGYKASAQDLYSLHRLGPQDFYWIFPQGPIEFTLMPGVKGFAWFDIQIEQILNGAHLGHEEALERGFPVNLQATCRLLDPFFSELGIEKEDLILGGFSQGGMLAIDLAMNAPIPVRGLIALSTTSVASYGWTEKAKKHKGLHYFQSHGLYDELLPFKKAKKLFEDFQAAGLRGTFEGFIGEHEIPLEVLSRLKGFLSDLK